MKSLQTLFICWSRWACVAKESSTTQPSKDNWPPKVMHGFMHDPLPPAMRRFPHRIPGATVGALFQPRLGARPAWNNDMSVRIRRADVGHRNASKAALLRRHPLWKPNIAAVSWLPCALHLTCKIVAGRQPRSLRSWFKRARTGFRTGFKLNSEQTILAGTRVANRQILMYGLPTPQAVQ